MKPQKGLIKAEFMERRVLCPAAFTLVLGYCTDMDMAEAPVVFWGRRAR